MAAGDEAAAARIDAEETDPAFAHITKDLQRLTAAEEVESRQALNVLKTGTVLGLGGAGAGIVALLCLLAYVNRRAAEQRARSLDELRQSQKMDAVGQLAGGVAHDFNNLLTAILGYSELALLRLGEGADPELRVEIQEIAKSGERAAELTRQLLALSRRQTLQSTVFDLNDAVSGTEGLLKRLLGTNIKIATTLDPRDCLVHADHGQIEQVVMNLAINARDAMPEGGVLGIETEAVVLSAAEAKHRFHAPAGEYVILRVADNGCGMEESTLQHAFEPFYTTKALGEGTGLGLATVYGIVGQSGGYIALDSEPGDGTVFELLLPRMAGVAPTADPTPPPATHGGHERILLVEDEEVVRQLTRDLLSREGYDVVVAAEGEEALELAREADLRPRHYRHGDAEAQRQDRRDSPAGRTAQPPDHLHLRLRPRHPRRGARGQRGVSSEAVLGTRAVTCGPDQPRPLRLVFAREHHCEICYNLCQATARLGRNGPLRPTLAPRSRCSPIRNGRHAWMGFTTSAS